MAGMFDDILRRQPEEGWTVGEKLTGAMIPVLGLVGAYGHRKWREKKAQEAIEAENAPKSDVGRRMLIRAQQEGFESIPAMIAAKQYSKQAGIYPDNPGNAMAATANWMSSQGYPDEGLQLARVSHKELQTPWKPSEAGLDDQNYKLPDGSLVMASSPEKKRALEAQGAVKAGVASAEKEVPWQVKSGVELGFKTPGISGDLFKVQYNSDGTIKDIVNLAGMRVNVGGTSIVTPGDTSSSVKAYQEAIAGSGQVLHTIDSLTEVLDRNPGGGVSGLSGVVTNFVSNVSNLAQFALTADDKQIGAKYEKGILQFASKYFPTADAASAQAQIIELAYALARMNNMGTSGGGRGITDADMQYALKQLGQMATVEDFKGVLRYQRNKVLENLEIARAGTEAVVKIAGQDPALLSPLTSMHDKIKAGAKKAHRKAPKEDEDAVRNNPDLRQDFIDYYGYDPLAE